MFGVVWSGCSYLHAKDLPQSVHAAVTLSRTGHLGADMVREYLAGSLFHRFARPIIMRFRPLRAGSLVTVKLDNGRIIQGEVKAVLTQSNGNKYQVSWGNETARISERNILDLLKS